MSGENVISIDEFSKIDLRVGRVLEAERVPGSKKLIRLVIDLGELGKRQVVAGLGEYYDPAYFVGKNVVVVANLKPKKMMGVVSQGMILAAGCDPGETPRLLTVDGDVKPGTKVC